MKCPDEHSLRLILNLVHYSVNVLRLCDGSQRKKDVQILCRARSGHLSIDLVKVGSEVEKLRSSPVRGGIVEVRNREVRLL